MSEKLTKAGIPHTTQPIYRSSAKSFRKAIRKATANNPNGWMVDVYKSYKGIKTYLTRDGKSGVAVKKDGTIISVFSAAKGTNAMGKLIPFAVAHGGTKLDAYAINDQGLASMYARYGARVTGKVKFNAEYAPDGWDGKSYPTVVAMVLPRTVDDIIAMYDRNADSGIHKVGYSEDYDAMLATQDKASIPSPSGAMKSVVRAAQGSGK